MKKIVSLVLCVLLFITWTGCANSQATVSPKAAALPSATASTQTAMPPASETPQSETVTMPPEKEEKPRETETPPQVVGSIPAMIPTNDSTNVVWDGCMCEANGFIYYVSGSEGKEKIVRAKQDWSNPVTVTKGDYACLHELTADNANLYFVSTVNSDDIAEPMDTIYRLPLFGGKEQQVAQGNVNELQNGNGMLFWVDYSGDDTPAQIRRINMDGSSPKTLFTAKDPDAGAELLVAGGKIYYTDGAFVSDSDGGISIYSNLYHMDLEGGKSTKIYHCSTGFIDKLFYDQGKLYFLAENVDDLNDSLLMLDAKSKAVTLLKNVGYFPQDAGAIEFCGISNNKFYYFKDSDTDKVADTSYTAAHYYFDLHQLDLLTKKNTVMLSAVEMGEPAIGTLFSIRGKSIRNDGVIGFYILGNDIYFSPYESY